MKSLNKKTIPLLLAVIIIWSFILVRVFEYFSASDTPSVEHIAKDFTINSSENIKQKENIVYCKIENDPFKQVRIKKQIKINIPPSKRIVEKKVPPALSFNIKGMISNNGKNMIILEDLSDKSTHFLKVNDSYKSIKILKITEAEITYLEANKMKTKEIK